MTAAAGGSPVIRYALIALALGTVALLVIWLGCGRADGRSALRLSWEQAERDPGIFLNYLAERAQDDRGVPDWRLLPESGRHVWAVLFVQMAGFETPPSVAGEPPAPTRAQMAEAFAAIGVGEAADLVRGLPDAQAGPLPPATVARFHALWPRISAARAAYAQAHRAELESPAKH